jgi:nucleoside 2-deoxyribosyltransferase
MLIYVAGPYRGDVIANIEKARKVAIDIWSAGHVAICPHLNTAHFEEDSGLSDERFLSGDLEILCRCDALVLTIDWEKSKGAVAEVDYARSLGIPVFTYPDIPGLHPTEQRSPIQVKAFLEIVMQMYRLHLSKNSDYSPMNILGTGEIGLITRLWDKIARLMNLTGFRINAELSSFEAPKQPKHESIEDTYYDGACLLS